MSESAGSQGASCPHESRRRAARFPALRRKTIVTVWTFSLILQQAGCYNAVPVTGAPTQPGRAGLVKIQINERGRLLVGKQLGSLIDNVTGRIVSSDSVNLEVAVETAEDVRGSMARWGGEKFTIPREGIDSMQGKKVSKWRTALLLGGIAVAIIGVVLGINNSAFSGKEDGGIPVDPI